MKQTANLSRNDKARVSKEVGRDRVGTFCFLFYYIFQINCMELIGNNGVTRHRSSDVGPAEGERGEAVAGRHLAPGASVWLTSELVVAEQQGRSGHQGSQSGPNSWSCGVY